MQQASMHQKLRTLPQCHEKAGAANPSSSYADVANVFATRKGIPSLMRRPWRQVQVRSGVRPDHAERHDAGIGRAPEQRERRRKWQEPAAWEGLNGQRPRHEPSGVEAKPFVSTKKTFILEQAMTKNGKFRSRQHSCQA